MKGAETCMDNWDNNFGNNNNFDGINELVSADNSYQTEVITSSLHSGGQDVFSYSDPLKYSHLFEFAPLNLDMGNTHLVQPHYVDPYIRQDGTLVDGYYRDGDGNTNIDTPLEQGGGYMRSNPDGDPFNNLK